MNISEYAKVYILPLLLSVIGVKMSLKTIKISDSNYKAVVQYAGEMQKSLGEPVSIDRAISFLLSSKGLSELAGSWEMSDKEADKMMKSLKEGWSKWKIKSV